MAAANIGASESQGKGGGENGHREGRGMRRKRPNFEKGSGEKEKAANKKKHTAYSRGKRKKPGTRAVQRHSLGMAL